MPEGVLELAQTYSYRIRAHRENAEVDNMDNISSSTWWRGLRPHFTTTDVADSDNDGSLDGVEDLDQNGQVDPGEGDPNVKESKAMPLLLLGD